MAYCERDTAVKTGRNGKIAVTLRCRSWTCPNCQDQRKRQLIAQGIGGKPTKFLTLTMRRREGLTPDQAAVWLSKSWRLLRLRIMRWYGLKSLPFLAVMEKTKLGWPHLHILLRSRFLDHELLSEWMWELCDSPMVWIEHLDRSHKAPIYCAKYCGKATEKFDTAKRYWQSRDYDLRPKHEKGPVKDAEHPWVILDWGLQRLAAWFKSSGMEVEWCGRHKIIGFYTHGGAPP